MQPWEARRDSTYDHGFQGSLEQCGLSYESWDRIAPGVDGALCGFTRAKLDAIYPCQDGERRLMLTDAALGVPALRVVFYLESEVENAKIVYVAGSRR